MATKEKTPAEIEACQVFSDNLNRLMNEKGIIKSELAAMMGVSKTQVGAWCSGKNAPRMNYIQKLIGIFECEIEDLLVDKTKSPPPNGDRLDAPPGYDKLSPANKALVDQMIAQLAKGQPDD